MWCGAWNCQSSRYGASSRLSLAAALRIFWSRIYLAGVDFADTGIQEHARSIERSYKMLRLMENAVNLLRSKHKFGETYYWILYYTYLSPQQYKDTEEIIGQLQAHIQDISYRTYFRRKKEAIDAFSSILWGYSSKDSLKLLEQFFPEDEIGR